jgi:ribulose-5-phosphate 4-epimerase/fuculose-1-phosphate aldolase
MNFAVFKNNPDPARDHLAEILADTLIHHGHTQTSIDEKLNFVLNLTCFDDLQAFHRKSKTEFVVSLARANNSSQDLRFLCYNALVQTLSNLLICIKLNGSNVPEVYCITPEAGFYHYPFDPEKLYAGLMPIVGSTFMICNRVSTDLPPEYHQSTPVVHDLIRFGQVLDSLGVLPAPFPLKEVLSQENIDHLYQLFKIKGLSYGNLSAREVVPGLGGTTFWMTARGVDKAHLAGIGQDILLVKGYDPQTGDILVSAPPGHNPRIRVSVDAIEHVLIYREFPEVGAIVHVHAWMDNIRYTRQNYPCGTLELAREVVEMLQKEPHPENAAVGLKNHGITVTGPSLAEIFQRIEGHLIKEVPMIP